MALGLKLAVTLAIDIFTTYLNGWTTSQTFFKMVVFFFLNQWPDYSKATYLCFICRIYFLEKSYVAEAKSRWLALASRKMAPQFNQEILLRKQIADLKMRFNKLFGIILLADLTFYLVFTSQVVVFARDIKKHGDFVLYEIPYFTMYTTLILGTFTLICHIDGKMNTLVTGLTDLLVNRSDGQVSSGAHALIDELNRSTPLTAMGQFTIEQSLLTSFTGSLISICVLLIQLNDQSSR
ncbi:hypothetical protein HDE_07785 [Halotydeus destructor]|nr:hypothetical protein HDE_07785 [Halotydeus destructor]